jgi:TctA family transporter
MLGSPCSSAGGAHSVGNNVGDAIVMRVFRIVGYQIRKFDYKGAPFILAMVIGPMMEEALRQSLILSAGSFLIFVARPISAGLARVIVIESALPVPGLGVQPPTSTWGGCSSTYRVYEGA